MQAYVLRINGKIDGLDFYILKSLKNTFDGKNAIERIYSKYNDEYNSDVSKKEVMNHFYYLTSLGLIEMSDQEEVEAFCKNTKNVYLAVRLERLIYIKEQLWVMIYTIL